MTLLAKSGGRITPTGVVPITLDEHTSHVQDEAKELLAARPFIIEKYARRTGRDLAQLLDECARWHDKGKAHPCWQSACQKDHEIFKRTGKEGHHLLSTGIRHEMDSLRRMEVGKVALPACGFIAVAAHHRKLSHRHEDRWLTDDGGKFKEYWKQFGDISSQLRHSISEDFDRAIARRYEYDGPRALLQLADGRASAMESGESVPPLLPFSYTFRFRDSPRGVQQLIGTIWDEPFAILRAPTGAGKTDAALLWAEHQIEMQRADRLVIAMPTRFTANALSISNAENLSSTGLYHSSSWYQDKAKNKHDDPHIARQLAKEATLARHLETPVTVTTLDHLCICLTGAREDHHAIFWGLAHACVVIDEVDFYDDFTQRNMVVLLRALRLLEVPVLIMSATVPESARQLYALSGLQSEKIYEDTSDHARLRCALSHAGPVTVPEDIALLLQRALDGEPAIIYANTVERAQNYRRWFAAHDFDDVVLYHSRFTELDKKVIEDTLISMLGKVAWQEGSAHGVAILTQIGELSVNISADLMISDLCPVDRLAQRAGRLARFQKRDDGKEDVIGELHLVEPMRAGKDDAPATPYPAPYGEWYTGNGWVESRALAASREWLKEGDYAAKDWVDGVNKLYSALEEPSPKASENQRQLENSVVINWLIVPKAEAEAEDDDTHIWHSRDIPPQTTVYVGVNTSACISGEDDDAADLNFRTRSNFREWALEHGVPVYSYQVRKAQERGALIPKTAIIGEDSEAILLVAPQYYDNVYGLMLNGTGEVNEDDDF